MKFIVVFSLLVSTHLQARGIDLLRNNWQRGLTTVSSLLLASTVLFSPIANADDGNWREVRSHAPKPFHAVIALQKSFTDTLQHVEHLLYLGHDRHDMAVFLTLYESSQYTIGVDTPTNVLRGWDGIINTNIQAKRTQILQVDELIFHDLAIVRIAGQGLEAYDTAELARFPYLGTPLNQVSYLYEDGDATPVEQPEEDAIAWRKVKLFWKSCHVQAFDSTTMIGTHNCYSYPDPIKQGAVIVNALTGDAVGFHFDAVTIDEEGNYIIQSKVLGFSPELLALVQEIISINPVGKLTTSWGKLKKNISP